MSRTSKQQNYFVYWLEKVLVVCVLLVHIGLGFWQGLTESQLNSIHFASFILLASHLFPFTRKEGSQTRHPFLHVIDFLFCGFIAVAALLISFDFETVAGLSLRDNSIRFYLYLFVIIGTLEMARRAVGLFLPFVVFIIMFYAIISSPEGKYSTLNEQLVTYLHDSIIKNDGLLGELATVSAMMYFPILLFSFFFIKAGALSFLHKLSVHLFSRYKGGSGYLALVINSFTSGMKLHPSGQFQYSPHIPFSLMMRQGYLPLTGAPIKTSAALGGLLFLPFIGPTILIMTLYADLSLIYFLSLSFIPIALYISTLLFQIRIEAHRNNDIVMEIDDTAKLDRTFLLEGLVFFGSLGIFVCSIIAGYSLSISSSIGILGCIVLSMLTPDNKMNIQGIYHATKGAISSAITIPLTLFAFGLLLYLGVTTDISRFVITSYSEMIFGYILGDIILLFLITFLLGWFFSPIGIYILMAVLFTPILHHSMLNNIVLDTFASQSLKLDILDSLLIANPEIGDAIKQPVKNFEDFLFLQQNNIELYEKVVAGFIGPDRYTMSLIVSHMAILWISLGAYILPPSGSLALSEAKLSNVPTVRLGLASVRQSFAIYLIPIIILTTPIVSGNIFEILTMFFFAIFGMWALSAAVANYLEHQLSLEERLLLLLIGGVLISPAPLFIKIICLTLFILSLAISIKHN